MPFANYLVICLAFLVLQLYLLFSLVLYWRKWRYLLAQNSQSQLNQSYPWHQWINQQIQLSQTHQKLIDREEVLAELDLHLESCIRYQLLQRIGYSAPLLGVILTVLNLALSLPSTSALLKFDSQQLMSITSTLIWGVGIGAILAFLNQIWMLIASAYANQVRKAISTWLTFEPDFQSEYIHPRQANRILSESATGVNQLSNVIRMHHDNASAFVKLYHDMYQQVGELKHTFHLLSDQIGQLGNETKLWRSASNEMRAEAHKTVAFNTQVSEAVANYSDQFTGITSALKPILNNYHEQAEHFQQLFQNLEQYNESTHSLLTQQTQLYQQQQTAWQEYLDHAQNQLIPAQHSYIESTQALASGTLQIQAELVQLSNSLQQVRTQSQGVAAQWNEQANTLRQLQTVFHDSIHSPLKQVVVSNQATVATWQNIANMTQQSFQDWEGILSHANSIVSNQVVTQQDTLANTKTFLQTAQQELTVMLSAAQQQLQTSAQTNLQVNKTNQELEQAAVVLAKTINQFQHFIQTDFAQSNQIFADTLSRIEANSTSLTKALAAVVPQLQHMVEGINQSTASLQPLENFSPQLNGLIYSMSNLTQSLQAIQQIPQKLDLAITRIDQQARASSISGFLKKWNFFSSKNGS
jgi:hypothetical protein